MIRLKKARLCDISRMQELVKEEVQNGVILPLESDEIAANIRSYVLAFGCDSKADTNFDSKENLSFDSKENSDLNLAMNSNSNLARNADLNLIQSSAANFAENPAKKFAENAAGNFAPQLATPQSVAQVVSEAGCAQAGKEQILRSEYSQSAGVFQNDLSRLCESQSAKNAEILAGFASLKIFNADLAEVRSLIVAYLRSPIKRNFSSGWVLPKSQRMSCPRKKFGQIVLNAKSFRYATKSHLSIRYSGHAF